MCEKRNGKVRLPAMRFGVSFDIHDHFSPVDMDASSGID